MIKSGKYLSENEIDILKVIKEVYDQQKEMFDNHKHSVANRIVNLNQPHVRPIVRGKASAKPNLVLKLKLVLLIYVIEMLLKENLAKVKEHMD